MCQPNDIGLEIIVRTVPHECRRSPRAWSIVGGEVFFDYCQSLVNERVSEDRIKISGNGLDP